MRFVKRGKLFSIDSKTTSFVVTTNAEDDEEVLVLVAPFLTRDAYDALVNGDDSEAKRELKRFADSIKKSLAYADRLNAKVERRIDMDVKVTYAYHIEVFIRRHKLQTSYGSGHIQLFIDGSYSTYLYEPVYGVVNQLKFDKAKGEIPVFQRQNDGKTMTLEDFVNLRLDGMGPSLIRDLPVALQNYHDSFIGPFLFKSWELVGFEEA